MSSTSSGSPPHNLDAERSALGSVLLNERALDSMAAEIGLMPDHFFDAGLGQVYGAMLELSRRGEKIDHLTVSEQLREQARLDGVGGARAVEELTAWVPASGNAREYGRIVRDNARLRALQRAAREILADIETREAPTGQLLDDAGRAVLAVTQDDRAKPVTAISDALQEELDQIQARAEAESPLTGTPSGFRDLDALTGGFQPSSLTILAARPGMGKSTLVMNIAAWAALEGRGVVVFSLEMSEAELTQRLLAAEASVPGEHLRRGTVSDRQWPKLSDTANKLAQTKMFLDDSGDTGVLDVRAKARRLHQGPDGPLGLVIVDYLQLMRADERAANRVEQVSQLSRGLKSLAKELEVPVIALSQLSRAVEQRADRRPIISDLRESGQIEADADLIMFIYREEANLDLQSARPNEADLIIAKHRSGPIGEIVLTFQGRYPRFWNYSGPRLERPV